jgi:hypothetical protein
MQCGLGGKMEFATSGQIPLPPDALEDIKKMQEEGLKEEEEGWGWLDTLELVPVIGSIVGAVREGMKGNWGMMVLNIGFLAADIAGVVSFGASTAASTAAKAAIKTGVKVAAKTAAKTAAKQVGKSGLKTGVKLSAKGAGKAFKSEMEGVVKKTGKSKKPVTSNPDPIGTFRDNAGRLRNKNGTFAKDPNKKTFVSKPTESYNRKKHYGNTPKKSDRKHLGAGKDEVADHDPPLVKRYYEGDPKIGEKPGYQMTPKERKTSANDRTRMKKQSKEDSNKQGAEMSRYSKKKKEEYGL